MNRTVSLLIAAALLAFPLLASATDYMYVTEYAYAGRDMSQQVLPAYGATTGTIAPVTITTSSAQSAATSAGTAYVRIICTVACHIAWGASPTATASSLYLPANDAYVQQLDGSEKIAVIAH